MSEEQTQNTDITQDSEQQDSLAEQEQPEEAQSSEYGKKGKKGKKDKNSAQNAEKEQSRLKKEWEDSIVASKKVKREETRRKVKRAMLILLVFSLIVTSIVYMMLLFVQENSVRITARSENKEKAISMSVDNEYWTPYLNIEGPKQMWDLSYNPIYNREKIPTVDEVRELLTADDVETGVMNGNRYIQFVFMLKNTGSEPAFVNYEMTLEFDKFNLQDAVRVMWGESYKSNPTADVSVYAALSNNQRLASTAINAERTVEDGFIEYVAYPVGSDRESFSLAEYENVKLSTDEDKKLAAQAGYFATTPFASDEFVFQRDTTLAVGDIMYCYVSIWLEGSDFDCNDARLGGYCKLGLNFFAY